MEEIDPWGDKTPLHDAAANGDLDRVTELLDAGIDINAFDDMSFTALHYAVESNNIELTRMLLDAGADPNAREIEKIGNTPLCECAGNCSYEIAEILIKVGADPRIPGWMGLNALDNSKNRKKPEGKRVLALLLNTVRKPQLIGKKKSK